VTYHSDLVCELVQSSSVHDYQMQHVPFAGIFHLNVGAQPYEARHCSPSRSAGGQQQWRPALLVHSVYVGSLKTRSRESRRRPTKGWFVNGSYFYRGSSIAPITLDLMCCSRTFCFRWIYRVQKKCVICVKVFWVQKKKSRGAKTLLKIVLYF